MPTIETLDPRLQNIYKGMRPPGTPKYGLGYIEQCDQVHKPAIYKTRIRGNTLARCMFPLWETRQNFFRGISRVFCTKNVYATEQGFGVGEFLVTLQQTR